jgi:hypothetical protein
MVSLTIGFSAPKKNKFPFFSFMVRLIERTPFSHVYMQIEMPEINHCLIYHASDLRIHFTGENQFNQANNTIYKFIFKINKDVYNKIITFCINEAGKPYGFLQICGIMWVKFMALFDKHISNPFVSYDKTQICSEAIGKILIQYMNITINKNLDVLTPSDIFKILKQYAELGVCDMVVCS